MSNINSTQVKATSPPEDKHSLVYLLFLLQGTTVLYAFNAYISNLLFPSIFDKTFYAKTHRTWATWAIMLTTLIASFILTTLPNRYKLNPSKMVLVGWVGMGIVSVVSSIMPFFVESISGEAYFQVTLAMCLLMGLSSGSLQNSLYGIAANLPPVTFQAISVGQGLCSFVITAVLVLFKVIYPQTSIPTDFVGITFTLFLVGIILVIASFVTFFIFMTRSPYYDYYLGSQRQQQKSSLPSSMDGADTSSEPFMKVMRSIFCHTPSVFYPLSITFGFIVTFAVFPGMMAITRSVHFDANPNSVYVGMFLPLAFLTFSVSDTIGKFLPGVPVFFIKSHTKTLLFNLLRLVFIPLFMWFNFPSADGTGQLIYRYATRWIQSDTLFFIIVFLFGISQGYFGSILLMKAATSIRGEVSTPATREMMGKCMGLFLCFGLALGPLLALILQVTLG